MADDPVPRHLNAARACVDRLARDHVAVRAGMATYVGAVTRAGLDPAGTVEWTTVEAAAMRRLASQVSHYQSSIEHALRCLLDADTIRGLVVTANVDTTKAAAELRCDGYDDPTCVLTGVKDVWINGHNHWLCVRCHDRYRQAKRREGVNA